MVTMLSVIQGTKVSMLSAIVIISLIYSGLESFDGNYDSDEDADFTKMDMVGERSEMMSLAPNT